MLRNDFVSNSSSASFIVVSKEPEGFKDIMQNRAPTGVVSLPDPEIGRSQFGRCAEQFTSIGAKLNFAAIQLCDLNRISLLPEKELNSWYAKTVQKYIDKYEEYEKMFVNVCKRLGFDVVLNYSYNDNNDYSCWIDHSSSVCEGENMCIFNDEETLYNFLKNCYSYIQMLSDEEEDDMEMLRKAREDGIICSEKTS